MLPFLLAVVPLTFLGAVLDLDTTGPYLLLVVGGGAVVAGVAAAVLRKPMPPLAVLLDDDQSGSVVAPGDLVEPVDRPVEGVAEVGPPELGERPLAVLAEVEQQVAGGAIALVAR